MPKMTAILHTHNDALRVGRALESMRTFDEILVIDHASTDATTLVARQYGAKVIAAGAEPGNSAHYDWLFYILPSEAVSESLEASLLEFSAGATALGDSYSVGLREEGVEGWQSLPPQTRLVRRQYGSRQEALPANDTRSIRLEGELLRFPQP